MNIPGLTVRGIVFGICQRLEGILQSQIVSGVQGPVLFQNPFYGLLGPPSGMVRIYDQQQDILSGIVSAEDIAAAQGGGNGLMEGVHSLVNGLRPNGVRVQYGQGKQAEIGCVSGSGQAAFCYVAQIPEYDVFTTISPSLYTGGGVFSDNWNRIVRKSVSFSS